MANNTRKLWGGRFKGGSDELAINFSSSIDLDKLLYIEDIEGSIAHVKVLKNAKLITDTELKKITKGLNQVKLMIEKNKLNWNPALEDIHTHVEFELKRKIGDLAKKIHMGRSRNDQVATDMRIFLRKRNVETMNLIKKLQKTVLNMSEKYAFDLFPGFTHLQVAQPLTFGYVLLSWFFMLQRDLERFHDLQKRINVSPLGSGALAGTSFPLDRNLSAKLLGFDSCSNNALDSVSDRDFLIEYVSCSSLLMTHISRFSEEIILWSSTLYNLVSLSDKVCTGSSIMPQKKNPDMCELLRGKVGIVNGNLMNLLTIMKAQPLAYNRDNQEDKHPMFSTVKTVIDSLEICNLVLKNMVLNKKNAMQAAASGYSNATDLADYLSKKGIPFRDAHKIVGEIVNLAEMKKTSLEKLDMREMKKVCNKISKDVYDILHIENSVNLKSTYGSTSKQSIKKQISLAHKLLKKRV